MNGIISDGIIKVKRYNFNHKTVYFGNLSFDDDDINNVLQQYKINDRVYIIADFVSINMISTTRYYLSSMDLII